MAIEQDEADLSDEAGTRMQGLLKVLGDFSMGQLSEKTETLRRIVGESNYTNVGRNNTQARGINGSLRFSHHYDFSGHLKKSRLCDIFGLYILVSV